MNLGKLSFVSAAVFALALGGAPATAASSGQAAAVDAAAAVGAFYGAWQTQPIWFRGGVNDAAVSQLVAILQRAPFDGFAAGPQLAAQVQAAAAQARTGNPADVAAADQLLSTAWVQYVQSVKRATPGMIYAYPNLEPHGTRADQILLTAAAAPSLADYLVKTANPNPLYTQLRDTAWAQARASGNMTPDPRLLANLDRLRSIP